MSAATVPTPLPTEAEIEALIASDSSPVGIDAKKTHVLILRKLLEIEQRLVSLEGSLDDRLGKG